MSYEREINPPSFYLDTDDEFCKNKKCGVELWPSNSKNGYCLCCIEEEKADRMSDRKDDEE